jgi:hypothetical protein
VLYVNLLVLPSRTAAFRSHSFSEVICMPILAREFPEVSRKYT